MEERSNCCNAPIIENTDLCSQCKEHCEVELIPEKVEDTEEDILLDHVEEHGKLLSKKETYVIFGIGLLFILFGIFVNINSKKVSKKRMEEFKQGKTLYCLKDKRTNYLVSNKLWKQVGDKNEVYNLRTGLVVEINNYCLPQD